MPSRQNQKSNGSASSGGKQMPDSWTKVEQQIQSFGEKTNARWTEIRYLRLRRTLLRVKGEYRAASSKAYEEREDLARLDRKDHEEEAGFEKKRRVHIQTTTALREGNNDDDDLEIIGERPVPKREHVEVEPDAVDEGEPPFKRGRCMTPESI